MKEISEGYEIPIVNASNIQEIPVVSFDGYRELLDQEKCIENYTENFKIHPEIGKTLFAPTGDMYRTYAVGIYLTQELIDDFPNIREKAEIFLWNEVCKFFENAKKSFKKIYWRKKPEILEMNQNRCYVGKFYYIRMRLLME